MSEASDSMITMMRHQLKQIDEWVQRLMDGHGGGLLPQQQDDLAFLYENAAILHQLLAQDLPNLTLRTPESRRARHDLMSPISNIMGFIYVLESGISGPLTPEQRDLLRGMNHCCITLQAALQTSVESAVLSDGT